MAGTECNVVRSQARATPTPTNCGQYTWWERWIPKRQINRLDGVRVKGAQRSDPSIVIGRKDLSGPCHTQHPRQHALPLTLASAGQHANRQDIVAVKGRRLEKEWRPTYEG
jgi:hypothetical protein